ncbi:hypothetical protein PENTCL1PPCAC_23827, partial [Pristionchus entomophagus]
LLKRDFVESAWNKAKQLGTLDKLIWRPPLALTDQFKDSFRIRGLMINDTDMFTEETNRLYSYFKDNLSPEQARFVICGVRLGLAAHVICYVAECVSSHKLNGRPTKIAKNWEAIGESDVIETFVNVSALSEFDHTPIRHYDMGDSVAKAGLAVTWMRHLFLHTKRHVCDPSKCEKTCLKLAKYPVNIFLSDNQELEPNFDLIDTYDETTWKELENQAAKFPDGAFWSGRWCSVR